MGALTGARAPFRTSQRVSVEQVQNGSIDQVPAPHPAGDRASDAAPREQRGGRYDGQLVRGITALTHAARTGQTAGIVTTLSKLINGWAVVIDRYGTPIASVGASRIHHDDAVAAALRLSRRIRVTNLGVYPVGHPLDPKAQLVISDKLGSPGLVRELATQATALLDLTFSPQHSARLDPVARADAIDVLLARDEGIARRVAARWGLVGSEFSVAVIRSRSRSVVLESKVLDWLDELRLPHLASSDGSTVIVVLDPAWLNAWAERLERASREGVPVRCGVGEPAALGQLAGSRMQAEQAVELAIADDQPCVRFADLDSVDMLLRHLTPIMVHALKRPLDELTAADASGDLLHSLRVFLAENGSWEASSSQLGIHRHTLRSRIQKVEDLTGMSMSNAEDRVQLWLAIRASSLDS
nr:helix-turn-helix domain-containing protein [Cryobacterium sp. BB307]